MPTFRATWCCNRDVEPRWNLLDTASRVWVDGDAPLEIGIRMTVDLPEVIATLG